MRPLSACFWTWCNPCFSFGFCHSNLGLRPWVLLSQLALEDLLGRNHLPFYSMLPGFFLPQGGFPQSGWKAFHTGWAIICVVFCHQVSLLLSQEDPIEFLWTDGKDVNLGKFLVSYFTGCDYGIDKILWFIKKKNKHKTTHHFFKRCFCQLYIFLFIIKY